MISPWSIWNALSPASHILLWVTVLFLGSLLLGTLRCLELLRWRMEQLEATTPNRVGRGGLMAGKKAPDFTLPSVLGPEVSLHDFAGRGVFLVFTQAGCGPCLEIMPELNRLARGVGFPSNGGAGPQVVVINNGDLPTTRKWSIEAAARFPVLIQDKYSISKKYQVFATPFAFLIDECGVISSKGLVTNRQHIGYVLSGARAKAGNGHVAREPDESAEGESSGSPSLSPSEEVRHV
jgi:methylamine dehydrogenase accessory protein MauD